jgi:hypothetical protein
MGNKQKRDVFWVVISVIWSKVSGFGFLRPENERQSFGNGKKEKATGVEATPP